MADGVTTLEVKSGYGLDFDNERKMLSVARQVGDELGIQVRATFLGAHALPPEFAGNADGYIDAVVDWLPRLHAEGLVEAVDAFCERIGFTLAQTRRVFEAARTLGLPVKLHAASSATARAQRWWPSSAGCRPTTSNTPRSPVSPRWPRPARWRCCCPAPSTCCARHRCRRYANSAHAPYRWRWRPTANQAPRR